MYVLSGRLREQFVLAQRNRPWQSVELNPKGTIAINGSDDGLVTISSPLLRGTART